GEGSVNSGNFPLAQSKVPASIMAPPIAVPFPAMYLVREWITILAPCAMGFNNAGDATVLSTINGTLAVLASLEMAFRSNTSSFGLPKDSTKKALVFSCTALAKLAGSEGSTKVVVMPNRGKVTLKRLKVPPYKLLDETIWSPAFSSTKRAVLMAAVPEEVTTEAMPPSKAASRCSKISLVG